MRKDYTCDICGIWEISFDTTKGGIYYLNIDIQVVKEGSQGPENCSFHFYFYR